MHSLFISYHFPLIAGNCITFGGDYYTGLINPRRDDIDMVGAVVGDGILFQSFIINGFGVYQHEETQITDLLGNFTFQDFGCPGQDTEAPRCEYCLDESNWTGGLCTTSSADSDCGQPAVIEVDAGVETRLRFTHAGALFASQVCIDGHSVDIIAADGFPVEPYTTNCFIIFTAERYDVIIKVSTSSPWCHLDQISLQLTTFGTSSSQPETPGDYWIRFTTTEQETAASFVDDASNVQNHTHDFPHHGYAILRVKDSESSDEPQYLTDYSPMDCVDNSTVNCDADYVSLPVQLLAYFSLMSIPLIDCKSLPQWFTSMTMGCTAAPSRMHPERCVTSHKLCCS